MSWRRNSLTALFKASNSEIRQEIEQRIACGESDIKVAAIGGKVVRVF
ncbi:hypothetical protein ACGFX8_36265 [Streptomyces sp. NPDC048362]